METALLDNHLLEETSRQTAIVVQQSLTDFNLRQYDRAENLSRIDLMRLICTAILMFSICGIGLADGGSVQLQAAAPPFVVTVFTNPPQCRAGQVDLSALVQEEKSPVLDAEVVVSLSLLEPAETSPTAAWMPPACASTAAPDLQNVPLQVSQGTNRLFYSTLIQIPYAGRWQAQVNVRRGTDHATVQGILNVDPPLPPVTAYWQWFLLPLLAIGGFALNQHIRAERKQKIAKTHFQTGDRGGQSVA